MFVQEMGESADGRARQSMYLFWVELSASVEDRKKTPFRKPLSEQFCDLEVKKQL